MKFLTITCLLFSLGCASYTLTPKMLNKASSIRGIKLPKNYDVSKVQFHNRNIDFVDFSLVKGLTVGHLNRASSIIGFKFPKDFDVTGLDTKRKDLGEIDFSNVVGLTAKMLSDAQSIEKVKLPKGFDLTGVNFSNKSLWRVDLSKTKNLTVNHLNQASSLSEIILPEGFDLKGLKTASKDISGIDLSKTKNLSIDMLNNASNIDAIVFPDGMSFKGFKVSKNKLFRNNFSMVKDFPLSSLDYFYGNSSVTLPQVDFSNIDLSKKLVSRVSLKHATGLNVDSFKQVKYLPSQLPDGFDVSSMSMSGKVAIGFDARNIVGFTARHFISLDEGKWIKYPKDFSFEGIDIGGKSLESASHPFNCEGSDLFKTLNVEQLNSALSYEFNCFSEGFNVEGLKLEGNKRGLNFSKAKGLKGKDLSNIVNMRYSTFPDGFDFTGFDASGTSLRKLDLSKSKGLTTAMLNNSSGLAQLKLPKMNMDGFDPSGKYLWKVDFSEVDGLTVSMLEKASSLSELKFPVKFDFTGFNASGKDLSFSDFENIK